MVRGLRMQDISNLRKGGVDVGGGGWGSLLATYKLLNMYSQLSVYFHWEELLLHASNEQRTWLSTPSKYIYVHIHVNAS